MKLKGQKFLKFILPLLFIFLFGCFILRMSGIMKGRDYASKDLVNPIKGDDFDPALIRLSSMDKLIAYCDSFYHANASHRSYPGIVSEVLRYKFYHGYSYYNMKTDPLAVVFEPLVKHGATAIVIPDDIVKHPSAACSQQSIVGMEIFARKGYPVRTISMYDSIGRTGHFTYEVYYDNSWHYFDTNQEPDTEILRKYNRPSVAFLALHPEIVLAAYHKKPDPTIFERLVSSYKLGKVDAQPAPQAYFYQAVTKFFSFFGWLFIGGFILAYRWYLKWKLKKAKVSQVENSIPGTDKVQSEIRRTLEAAKAV